MTNVTSFWQTLRMYNGENWFFALFLIALAIFWLREGKENKQNILISAGASFLIVFNEIAYRIAGRLIDTETYYRFLWMVPVVPMLAYAVVDGVIRAKGWLRKGLVLGAAAVLIVFGGTPYLTRGSLPKPSQVEYIKPDVRQICALVAADKDKEYAKVAAEMTLTMGMRLEDPTIKNTLYRETFLYDDVRPVKGKIRTRQHYLYRLIYGHTDANPKKIRRYLKNTITDYVVIDNDYQMDDYMAQVGCTILTKTDNYTIYKSPDFSEK